MDPLACGLRSQFISSAFASDKPSPYTSLSSLYDFDVLPTTFSRQGSLDEFYTVTTGRSSISIAESVDTTHIDNSNDFSWSSVADVNTPRQTTPTDLSDQQQDARLLKVIKTILAQNTMDTYRNYVDEILAKDLRSMNVQYDNGKICLDVDGFRLRIFAIIRKCLANSTEANIVRIFEAIREKYDVKLVEEFPSVGSITHSNGYCKPCVFANKAVNSCKNGAECNFCHFQHKITRRKSSAKENQDASKSSQNSDNAQNCVYRSPSVLRKCQSVEPARNVIRQPCPLMERSAASMRSDTLGSISIPSISPIRDSRNILGCTQDNENSDDAGIDAMQDALVAKCLEFLELEHQGNFSY